MMSLITGNWEWFLLALYVVEKVNDEDKLIEEEKQVNINPQQQYVAPQQSADPKAEDWATKNTWFAPLKVLQDKRFLIFIEKKEKNIL